LIKNQIAAGKLIGSGQLSDKNKIILSPKGNPHNLICGFGLLTAGFSYYKNDIPLKW